MMPKSRDPYSPELRQKMIDLVRSGQTPAELSLEFEPSARTIHNWVRQADHDDGRSDDGAPCDDFYRAFEDRYRGSRELIRGRCQVYLPFVRPLLDVYDSCGVVDLGCGRGEWLELLGDEGFSCHGVDLDEGMLEACRERHLPVEKADAVDYLKGLPDESQAVVSGFHVAEHIPFERLRELVAEAFRVLQPAGLLILETPNPENLLVGACSFYVDPTHQRPLPPGLLSFLSEYNGFERTKLLRLNQPESSDDTSVVDLSTVLKGVSPDYAVVAQKNAPITILNRFNSAFEQEFGLTLEGAVARFESNLSGKLDTILSELRERLKEMILVEARLESELTEERESKARLESELTEARGSKARLESELTEERESKARLGSELTGVYTSMSWRVTWPLRRLLDIVKWLFRLPIRATRRLLRGAVIFVANRPALAERLSTVLDRYPRLKLRVTKLAAAAGWGPLSKNAGRHGPGDGDTREAPELNDLPETARRIYEDLKAAVENTKRKDD